MTPIRRSPRFACAALLWALPSLDAQSTIASRVAQAPAGAVQLEYAARASACGDGKDVVGYRNAIFARNFQSIGGWSNVRCVAGPIRVTLTVANGQVSTLRTQIGGQWPVGDGRVTNLGTVPSREASAYFFSLAPRLESSSGKDRTLLPAVLADEAVVVPPLLAIARDDARSDQMRRQAFQWLGLLGDASIIPVLVGFARQGTNDLDGKKSKKSIASAAIAALGSLEEGVGVPALIELARRGPASARHESVFWLGQNGDPRAIRTLHTVIEDANEEDKVRAHAIFSLSHGSDVSASEFAYLRGIYPRLEGDALKEAVMQAMQQDESAGSRWLIAQARDQREPVRLRRTALFWAGQRESTPTADLVSAYRDGGDAGFREHAIFVLSQRQDEAATEALLRIAREDSDTKMRGKALFWLAQKNDPRVTKLISDLLVK